MKKVFVVTINIAIEAENESEVCDCLAETLRDQFLDWQYVQNEDGTWPIPQKITVDLLNYEEGDAFQKITTI